MLDTKVDIFFDRQAVKEYDPNFKLSHEELSKLIQKANQAPSAWNLQHWKYIVVHSDEAKDKLLPIAFNQQQVKDSSATVILLADLEADKNIEPVFGKDVLEGRMTEAIKEVQAKQVNGAYKTREYAFESGVLNSGLAGMQLINAATLEGLSTCAIGGFKRTDLIETFNIDSRYLPVMLITIGKGIKDPRRTSRLSVEETTQFI